MPKARGKDIDDVLLDMEDEKGSMWDFDDEVYDGVDEFDHIFPDVVVMTATTVEGTVCQMNVVDLPWWADEMQVDDLVGIIRDSDFVVETD